MGQTIKISGLPFTIVGTFRESVETFGASEVTDDTVVIPFTVCQYFTGTNTAKQIYFSMSDSSMVPAGSEQIRSVIASNETIAETLSVQAVYTGPEEVIVAAKVRPTPGLTTEELSRAMDDLDHALRQASPFVADVYIDVTSHRGDDGDGHA